MFCAETRGGRRKKRREKKTFKYLVFWFIGISPLQQEPTGLMNIDKYLSSKRSFGI